MSPLEVEHLTKHYGRHPAVRDITFALQPGTIVGFLGPNGAGKTTTIRVLTGLLRPTAGTARIFGLDCWRRRHDIAARIGYLPGDVRLYDNWRAGELIRFFARARGRTNYPNRLLDRFPLDTSRRIRDFSRGMRQKLALIIALMHEPDLLILDEPTSGLDPLMAEALYDELRATARAGRTVLFSSHVLAEVEALCQRVIILRAGRIVADGPVEDLRAAAPRRVRIRFAGPLPADGALPPGLQPERRDHNELTATWQGPPAPLLEWLAACRPEDVTIVPPDLEDLFLAYYRDSEPPQ